MGHFVLPQTEIDSTASTTGSDVAVRVHFNDVSTRYTALSISPSLSICDVIAVTFLPAERSVPPLLAVRK